MLCDLPDLILHKQIEGYFRVISVMDSRSDQIEMANGPQTEIDVYTFFFFIWSVKNVRNSRY